MIMLIESEKVVSMPPSFARPVFTMYDKLRPFAESKKKTEKEEIVCYIDRSFLLPCSNFSSSFDLFASVRNVTMSFDFTSKSCIQFRRADERTVPFLSKNDWGFLPEVKQILSIANRETNFWPF